jgi:hypothetical protein
VLFLLKDHQGRALLIAQAASKLEADEFGRAQVPDFCGESHPLEVERCEEAEEVWGVRTVRVASGAAHSGATVVKAKTRKQKSAITKPVLTTTLVWVRGLDLPEEVVADDLLTPEDHRDLALDHIARTSRYVGRLEIRKWSI